jgi:hypothetical protein
MICDKAEALCQEGLGLPKVKHLVGERVLRFSC